MSDSTGEDAGIGKYYPLLLIITIKINSFTEEVSDVNIQLSVDLYEAGLISKYSLSKIMCFGGNME